MNGLYLTLFPIFIILNYIIIKNNVTIVEINARTKNKVFSRVPWPHKNKNN
jgi:hypothetical protein